MVYSALLSGDVRNGSDCPVRFGRAARQLHPHQQTFATTIKWLHLRPTCRRQIVFAVVADGRVAIVHADRERLPGWSMVGGWCRFVTEQPSADAPAPAPSRNGRVCTRARRRRSLQTAFLARVNRRRNRSGCSAMCYLSSAVHVFSAIAGARRIRIPDFALEKQRSTITTKTLPVALTTTVLLGNLRRHFFAVSQRLDRLGEELLPALDEPVLNRLGRAQPCADFSSMIVAFGPVDGDRALTVRLVLLFAARIDCSEHLWRGHRQFG